MCTTFSSSELCDPASASTQKKLCSFVIVLNSLFSFLSAFFWISFSFFSASKRFFSSNSLASFSALSFSSASLLILSSSSLLALAASALAFFRSAFSCLSAKSKWFTFL